MGLLRADLTEIYRRFYSRLSIKQATADIGETGVLSTVQPTIDVQDVLRDNVIEAQVVAVGATGVIAAWTCPAGFSYEVTCIRVFLSTGTYTFTQLLYTPVRGTPYQIRLKNPSSTTDTHWPTNWDSDALTRPLGPVVFRPGDYLGVNIDAHTVSGNLVTLMMGDRIAFL